MVQSNTIQLTNKVRAISSNLYKVITSLKQLIIKLINNGNFKTKVKYTTKITFKNKLSNQCPINSIKIGLFQIKSTIVILVSPKITNQIKTFNSSQGNTVTSTMNFSNLLKNFNLKIS